MLSFTNLVSPILQDHANRWENLISVGTAVQEDFHQSLLSEGPQRNLVTYFTNIIAIILCNIFWQLEEV